MSIEIERKFLVDYEKFEEFLSNNNLQKKTITQGYLYSSKDETVRVRHIENDSTLNAKTSIDQMSRHEFETKISDECAISILKKCNKKLSKNRYIYDRWEIDVFLDIFKNHKPLVIAEIELSSKNETLPKLPNFIIEEVTNNSQYFNNNLAKMC